MKSENRNRWLLAICLLIALLATSCARATSEAEPPAVADEAQEPEAPGGQIRQSPSLVDSEELIGLGELGLLPALLQSLGAVSECDFDDALSTCQ